MMGVPYQYTLSRILRARLDYLQVWTHRTTQASGHFLFVLISGATISGLVLITSDFRLCLKTALGLQL